MNQVLVRVGSRPLLCVSDVSLSFVWPLYTQDLLLPNNQIVMFLMKLSELYPRLWVVQILPHTDTHSDIQRDSLSVRFALKSTRQTQRHCQINAHSLFHSDWFRMSFINNSSLGESDL